jgi:hypothetical protein
MIGGPAQIEIIKGGPSAQVVLELGSFSYDQPSLRAAPERCAGLALGG